MNEKAKSWYEASYGKDASKAQRKWPNEELARFIGRTFGSKSVQEKNEMQVLEVGCGSGANCRLLIEEGFSTFGLDFSNNAIEYCKKKYSKGIFSVADMMHMPYEDETFDCIVDIFSSYCLNESKYKAFVSEVKRVLKKGGVYFCYTPSKNSDAFINYKPAEKIDDSTLNGIYRKDSPYYGNEYDWRFEDEQILTYFQNNGFEISYNEKVGRTYRDKQEYFEFMTFSVIKL